MAKKDMEINREVQRVLARQDVDINLLNFRVHGGQLSFSGELEKKQGQVFSDPEELEKLNQKVGRIPGVIRVEWDLENWNKNGNGWERV